VPNLKLIESNRLEVLSQALAETLATPLSSPLTPELIVVQSRGMQRWLSMELARMHGICSNIKWPFPNAFVLDMFSRILPGLTLPPIFEKDALMLRIMDCLPDLLALKDFARIKDYLENDEQGVKLYQFSSMMANLYDQYVIFRPELILRWEKGKKAPAYPEKWQAMLWRKVIEGSDPHHRARLKQHFAQEIIHADISLLPERVSIFGISYLPAFHLEMLKGLSERIDVSIYCLNPCREYWADIVPARRIARTVEEDMHWESRNDLLAGMGRLGRNFLDMVLDLDPQQFDLFEEGGGDTMLAQVQADILNLRLPGGGGVREVKGNDRSIQVHSCHSPMREVEVLLDTLLDLFERDPCLEPRDILVMAPDIEAYAPLIRAVFDKDRDDACRIPYSISDRSFRRSSMLADALMAVIDLAGRRYEASMVMDLLDKEPVRRRFGVDEGDLGEIHAWVTGAGIRWGRDGKDKEDLGLPGYGENTWHFGLARLLLGYAMEGGDELFAGIAPFDGMDPGFAELLGRFADFVERLFAAVDELRRDRGPAGWTEVLLRIIDDLFAMTEDGVQEMLQLKAVVRDLEKAGQDAGFRGTLSSDVLRQVLGRAFGHAAEGAGFLERGVTFCSMLPMRSVPLKVICLLGMNHEAFPRRDYANGLDLMAMEPRKGDRSRRDDDLYLFLEALLSARDVLSISYIGQGIQDNAAIPPSVVVSSLLEYLDRAFERPKVVRSHCLQAFNPKYFTPGSGLFSYSPDNALAARALRIQGREMARAAKLAEPGEEFRTVGLERLLEFFRAPARFFLRHRLGAALPWEEETLLDREPFDLAGLERYGLQQRILMERRAGKTARADLQRLRAEGVLPHGAPGEMALDILSRDIDAFFPLIERAMEGREMVRKDVSLKVDGFTVTGSVESLGGTGLLSFRYAKMTSSDLMRAWLALLLLQATHPGERVTALHIHSQGMTRLGAVEDPLTMLRKLLDVYWQGLCKAVHFFPKSSLAYAETMKKHGRDERAMQEARKTWEGSMYLSGEAKDPSLLICFPRTDPLDGEFRETAMAVYGPILDAVEAGA